MRRLALLVIGVLVGCGHLPGLSIEVTTDDPRVASVEVFVGSYCPDQCPDIISPPGLTQKAVDRVFVTRDRRRWIDDSVVDGVAEFRLRPGDTGGDSVGLVLILGRDGEGAAIAAAWINDITATDDSMLVRVALQPATPIDDAAMLDQAPPADLIRLGEWQRPDRPACLLLEHWRGEPVPRRQLVVPEDDRDCDMVAAPECAPWTHLAQGGPATLETSRCFRFEPPATLATEVCQLGGLPCDEVTPAAQGCIPVAGLYCAPARLCGSMCPDLWDTACRAAELAFDVSVGLIPGLSCTFPVDPGGNPCNPDEVVQGVSASGFLGAPPSTTCKALRVAPFALPVTELADRVTTPSGTLGAAGITDTCEAEIRWRGTPLSADTERDMFFADLELESGAHLWLPGVVSYVRDCASSASCKFSTANATGIDPMLTCAQPQATPSCLPTSGMCAGPTCAGVCCKQGESCGADGLCHCGNGPGCPTGDTCEPFGPSAPDGCGSVCCGPTSGVCPV